MKPLIITETEKTPFVFLNNNEGKLFIGGKSIPEDVYAFYGSVNKWLENYIEDTKQPLELHFIFEYINAGSTKCVFRMLKGLEKYYKTGKSILVKWYYEEDDDDMLEISFLFKQNMQLPYEEVIIDTIEFRKIDEIR